MERELISSSNKDVFYFLKVVSGFNFEVVSNCVFKLFGFEGNTYCGSSVLRLFAL